MQRKEQVLGNKSELRYYRWLCGLDLTRPLRENIQGVKQWFLTPPLLALTPTKISACPNPLEDPWFLNQKEAATLEDLSLGDFEDWVDGWFRLLIRLGLVKCFFCSKKIFLKSNWAAEVIPGPVTLCVSIHKSCKNLSYATVETKSLASALARETRFISWQEVKEIAGIIDYDPSVIYLSSRPRRTHIAKLVAKTIAEGKSACSHCKKPLAPKNFVAYSWIVPTEKGETGMVVAVHRKCQAAFKPFKEKLNKAFAEEVKNKLGLQTIRVTPSN